MSLRLLYISVLGSDTYNEHILGILQAAAAPDTEVRVLPPQVAGPERRR